MTPQEKVDTIVQIVDDMKGEDIQVMDVASKTSIADFFIVVGANNERLLSAIADKVEEKMRSIKERPLRTEGGGGWILQDYGDVVLHIMAEEQRQFYDLETLWKTMNPSPDVR